jgi:acyl-CoA synthetase (AMP-forming)/AMP-acid ligase II
MSSTDSRTQGVMPTGATTLVDVLRARAENQPDDTAYTFLDDGESPATTWTWSHVDRRARAVAAWLQDRVAPGDRALLMYPPGLDFVAGFFGCLYAGVIAVPVTPPQRGPRQRGLDRVQAILSSAAPVAVLTAGESSNGGLTLGPESAPAFLDSSLLDLQLADSWQEVPVSGDSLAFLQFTSGSTASPKGVMVSHANLLHNLRYGFEAGESDGETVSVSWLPVTHDMGLIEGVLQPAFAGRPAYLMSPAAFLQRPARWLAAMSAYRATRSGGPNFAYDLCVSRVSDEERRRFDLSTWKAAYDGAEPVRAETLKAFADAYAGAGFRASAFRPCYGLAESTLLVSSGRWDASADDAHVSCGTPACGTSVAIVHPVTGQPCADGELGEIRVAGPSTSSGYWNDPEETARVFVTMPGSNARWLCTGDLGFVRHGQLHVNGRLKDLLIVRGAKHFPQDVERTTESVHHAVRPGGVSAVAVRSGIRGDLVLVVVEVDVRRLDQDSTLDDLMAHIRQAVAEQHGIQLHAVALVPVGTVPKTTSGKPRRYLCREAWNQGMLQPLAVWADSAQPVSPAAY